MGLFNACREFSTRVCSRYGLNQGKALIHFTAIAFFFSSLAQIYMIKTSKDISPEKKKFLIPQEIADGAISVGLVYTISNYVNKYFDSAIENGKYYLPKTQEIAMKLKPHPYGTDTFIKGVCDTLYEKNIIKVRNTKQQVSDFYRGLIELTEKLEDKSISKAKLKKFKATYNWTTNNFADHKALLKELKTAQMEFIKFKSGISVISAIAAGVITGGLIVPVARNIVANKYQKKHINKTNSTAEINNPQLMKLYGHPISSVYNCFVSKI